MNSAHYKVALVVPPFAKLIYGDEYALKTMTPSLGIFYIQSYCRDIADIKIFEGEFCQSIEDLIDEINEYAPDIIGLTSKSSTYPLCVQIAECTNAKFKIIGGPMASFSIEKCLENFDIVFIGDSEVSMREFLSGVPIEDVKGVAYKDKNGVSKINACAPFISLDDIPFPDHNKIQKGQYRASPHREMEAPFATMMTTRGCGLNCSFCMSAVGGMNNGVYRERSVKNVIDEINILTTQFGVKSIQFWDDTWTMRKLRTKEMCEEIKKFNISYTINTRTDKLDDEIINWLVDSGCKGVFLGVESGDQLILDLNYNKNIQNSQVAKVFSSCKKFNLRSTASFIFGSIDDTKESIIQSVDFALQLDADFVLFNIYTAHPGTSGFEMALKEGIICDYKVDYEKYKDEPVGIPTICRNLTRRELHFLKTEAYIKYYSYKNSDLYKQIIQTYVDELNRLKELYSY